MLEKYLVVVMNRFECNYRSCNRVLMHEGLKSFHCSMCGHGTMKLVKPEATYAEDGSESTRRKTDDIKEWEDLLHTKFIDTDDYNGKVALYETKVKEAEEAKTDVSKIRVQTFGSRLKILRKKLSLTQEQLAQGISLTKRSIINYEKNLRQLPNKIKDWVETTESTFKRIGKDKGRTLIIREFEGKLRESSESA